MEEYLDNATYDYKIIDSRFIDCSRIVTVMEIRPDGICEEPYRLMQVGGKILNGQFEEVAEMINYKLCIIEP